ncbi:MAG: site-specific DNA-methyltransferase [Burkholderiales bacterium]|nr:site-specific DNA-methyltransferase [Burkholderiales bacterium]
MRAPKFQVHVGDSIDFLRGLPDESVHAVVTDPPYGLSKHRQADVVACLQAWLAGQSYAPDGKTGFMGRAWDAWVPGPEVWREALRVLKPGGYALVFAGTRSMDLMSIALRLAGFELRDAIGNAHDDEAGDIETDGAALLAWVHGQGFPKSRNVAAEIDRLQGVEPTVVAHGRPVKRLIPGATQNQSGSWIKDDGRIYVPRELAATSDEARAWEGFGTGLKPAWEPIIIARKPLTGSIGRNVVQHGCGALNIEACRVEVEDTAYERNCSGARGHAGTRTTDATGATMFRAGGGVPSGGRWPANVVHDGSAAVLAGFPSNAGAHDMVRTRKSDKFRSTYGRFQGTQDAPGPFHGDGRGSAARFFFCPKTKRVDRHEGVGDPGPQFRHGATLRDVERRLSIGERRGNFHPTVKPTPLMRWLVRLVTPPGGTVVDMFAGSGSTGKAALLEGFNFLGGEADPSHVDIARARCAAALEAYAAEVAAESAAEPEQRELFG